MKTISISEFEKLLTQNWEREQDHEIIDIIERSIEVGQHDQENINHVFGWASKTSVLDGIVITYTEGFNYDEYEPESLSTGTEGQDDIWSIKGVSVIDEYGDKMDEYELADYLTDDFSRIDYSMLDIEQIVDIDTDTEDSDMETYTIEINNEPDLRFSGKLIGAAASSDNRAMGSSYNGDAGRWTELSLYKTKSGKYVCHQIGRTRWQGEHDRFSGKVCETIEEVIEFFGHRWLAKELYYDAGISDEIKVD